ncbi:MAG: sigma-54 dependent transcriptional regulator [Syntrophobacteraceae bacterium]|jgi:DNA-binding NtrC family response regulator|nr:sigma-54 dependent transcriptional regulator [Syntrophobacteraceae bacterium]
MMSEVILVVDDEEDMLSLLKRSLEPELGCRVVTASTAQSALRILKEQPPDLALIDMKMPQMDGMELLEAAKGLHPWLTVVIMTAHGCIELAVQAIKLGAYDFITKPFDHETLVLNLNKALERSRLLRENLRLQREGSCREVFQSIVGRSARMQRVYEAIQMVAKTDLTVLITGESGTGKDLAARAIHSMSDRRDRAFVAVNCPTVPENILESELFGYKKGAFTHATQNKPGLFQEAHGGSIFLDEIGDISTTIQTKLLRVLQQKEIKPLGDTKSVRVDVRVIASTNRNLAEKIKSGEFREDLFYRLNVVPIMMPPLRERREDIPLLVDHLLEKHCAALHRPRKRVSAELMTRLITAPWEGNVRELENVVVRSILFAPDEEIQLEHAGFSPEPARGIGKLAGCAVDRLPYREAKEEILRQFHEDYLGDLLKRTGGNVTHAARLCGLERQAFQQLLRRYGMRSEVFRSAAERM